MNIIRFGSKVNILINTQYHGIMNRIFNNNIQKTKNYNLKFIIKYI